MFKIKLLFYTLFSSFILVGMSESIARHKDDESKKDEKNLFSFKQATQKKISKRNRYEFVSNPLDPNSFFIVVENEQKINNRKRVKTDDIQMAVVDPWLQDQRFIGAKDKSGNMVTTTRHAENLAGAYGLFQPDALHAINGRIAELRHNLYQQFYQNYVQPAGGVIKNNAPEGIYTKYKDMRNESELQEGFYEGMDLTQTGFYVKMNQNRDEIIHIVADSGQLLLQVEPHLNMSVFAKRLYKRRVQEFQEVSNLYIDEGNEHISFNNFLNQLEKTDAFLENTRQVFQSILSLETIEVVKKPVEHTDKGQQKFVPIAMKTGIDR